jgi:TolA-binding protein
MTSPLCPHAWQVEAVLDERLGKNAADGLARHLRSCPACRQHYEALTRVQRLAKTMPTSEPDELGWRRLRESILRQASGWQSAVGRSGTGRSGRALLVAALLGATTVALGAIGAFSLWHRSGAEQSRALDAAVHNATPMLARGKGSSVAHDQDAPPLSSAMASARGLSTVGSPDGAAPVGPRTRSARVTRASKGSLAEFDESPKPSTGLLFIEAMRSFSAGAYAAAERQLADFVAQSPLDSRAEDAAYLMVVCCQRRGDSACASRRAAEYMARFHNGLRSSRVRRILEQ